MKLPQPLSQKDFLASRHQSMQTDDLLLQRMLQKAVGETFTTKNRLIQGENSEVYEVQTASQQKYIIRISRDLYEQLEKEQWAITQCRMHEIPVPTIRLVEKTQYKDEVLTFCIMDLLPGHTLGAITGELYVKEAELPLYIKKAGEVLSRIHTIHPTHFGYFDKQGKGSHLKLSDFIFEVIHAKKDILTYSKASDIHPATIEKALSLIEENKEHFDLTPPTLIHNDFGPKHIFINQGIITGIIDFESAISGDPVEEFSRWDFYYGRSLPVEWLMEGYTNKALFDGTYATRFHLYKLHRALNFFRRPDRMSNEYALEIHKRHIIQEVAYFSSL